MTTTLASLITTQTAQQIFATLLAQYQAAGFPVQSWQPFGVERTRLMAIATGLASFSQYVPAIAGGGLLDYAPNYPGWTALTAAQFYQLPINAAVATQGNILATNAASVPYVFNAGNLIAVFGATLNRYLCIGGGTIPASGTLSIPFQAENAGASYADPNNSGAITLVTPLPGVTLTNPASAYSTPTHTGSGTGTLALSGSPVGPHSVVVTVTSTTSGGTSPSVSYTLDGFASNSVAVAAFGINIGFVAGPSGTSWVLGDTYSFTTPGSWITQQGANAEADLALAQRCRNKWATQSPVPTQSLYAFLATTTPTVGAQVTQVVIIPDSIVNNRVNVVVAGPLGVLPSVVLTAIQNYLTPRARGCDNPVVQSPTTLNVTIAGAVTCAAAQLAAVQAAIQVAIANLVNVVGINGTVRLASIEQAIMNVANVVDVSGLTINGSAANLTLGSSSSFVLPSLQPLNLSYVTV